MFQFSWKVQHEAPPFPFSASFSQHSVRRKSLVPLRHSTFDNKGGQTRDSRGALSTRSSQLKAAELPKARTSRAEVSNPRVKPRCQRIGGNRISITEVARARKTLRVCRISDYTAYRMDGLRFCTAKIDHTRDHTGRTSVGARRVLLTTWCFSIPNRSLLYDRNQGQRGKAETARQRKCCS